MRVSELKRLLKDAPADAVVRVWDNGKYRHVDTAAYAIMLASGNKDVTHFIDLQSNDDEREGGE